MRVVNLARRPFVNRRPVVRMAILLWVIAALLVLANLKLFTGYLVDSREIRAEIASTESDLATEARAVDQQSAQVNRINLGDRNRQALFLNSLISYRTFPWSALFDDLEKVTPYEVRLQSVQPVVRLASEQALSRAEQQARVDARDQRRSRRRSRTATARDDRRSEREPTTADETLLAEDEVKLELRGAAKTEDALVLFVDTLYKNPAFRRPLLRNESMSSDAAGPAVFFNIEVLYRTGKRFETLQAAAEDEDGSSSAADTAAAVETETPEPVVTPEPAIDAPAATPPPAQVATQPAPPSSPPSAAAPPPPTAPPATTSPRSTREQRARDRQLDEELAAARRATAERANEEEARQNEQETEREPVVDARRKRLEELRERARRRRENQEARGGRGVVTVPGVAPPRTTPPASGGGQTAPPPTGTGGAAQPPPPPSSDLNDDPGFAETPASGSPSIGGGMASLLDGLEGEALAREVLA